MRFALLIIIFISQPGLAHIQPRPYQVINIRASVANHSVCAHIFSNHRQYYNEIRSGFSNSKSVTVEPAFYRPAFKSTIEWRISRFFKLRARDGYSGYWTREPAPITPLPGETSQQIIDYFYDHWVTDFGRDSEVVNQLRELSRSADPLRRSHFGIDMEQVPWAGINLFDASSDLYLLSRDGQLLHEKGYTNPISDVELRFPHMIIPERLNEAQGESVHLYFLTMLTSLNKVKAAIPDLYYITALHLLVKLSYGHLESFLPQNSMEHDPNILNRLRQRRPMEPAPTGIMQPADRIVFPTSQGIHVALERAQNARLYGVTHISLLDFYLNQGWKIKESFSEEYIPDDIKIIYFPVDEFIRQFFLHSDPYNYLVSFPSDEGKESEEYRIIVQRIAEAMERAKRLEQTRRRL
jgi:hypothetical protein